MSKKVSFSENENKHETEDDSENSDVEQRQYNKFELLDLVDGDGERASLGDDGNDSAASEEDDDLHQVPSEAATANKPSSNNRRKPRKKRGKGKKKASQSDQIDDELAALAQAIVTKDQESFDHDESSRIKLLKINTKNLIPEAELKRIFGRGVIKDDKTKPRIHPGLNLQRSRFVSSGYFETKSSGPSTGPKMELDDTINNVRKENLSEHSDSTSLADLDKPLYFKFVHDKHYQEAQWLFMEAVNQGNSEYILHNTSAYPAHTESLVQLSHMIRVSEDYKTASEFIERALVVFEKGFHPKFNIATATCRLSYKRPENRTFFITIFKHINCCHRRGLRKTPFEYSKLLLSLEPENDPLMAVQLLDFFAIRCEEYDFLIEFYTKWDSLQKLPNIRFSVALAYFLKSRCSRQSKQENESNLKMADKSLKESLLLFPNFIVPLLDACSGEPDDALKKCSYFDYSVYSTKYKLVPETVDVLVNLYARRAFALWKQKVVLSWLEKNVADLVKDSANGHLDENAHTQHWTRFPKVAPKNLLRHIVLSDLDVKIPPSASSTSYIDIDPYPPTDSIVTYDPTKRNNQAQPENSASGSGASLFEEVSGLFLRSILPSFSMSEPSANATGQQPDPNARRVNQQAGNPNGRAVISRIPEGGALLRISGGDRQESHYLDRDNAESLMTIINGLQDLQGLQVEEVTSETEAQSAQDGDGADSNQQQSSSENQDGLRRRQQPR